MTERETGTQGMGQHRLGPRAAGQYGIGPQEADTQGLGSQEPGRQEPGPQDPAGAATVWPPRRVPVGALITYLLVAFGASWLVALPLWLSPQHLASPWAQPLLMVLTYTPTLAVLLVAVLLRTPGRPWLRALGLSHVGSAGRFIGRLAIAFAIPTLLVIAAVCLAATIGWLHLDLVHFSGLREVMQAKLEAVGAPASTLDQLPPMPVLAVSQLLSIPVGALINSLLTLGEEIGWRGWLLPALRPLGVWPALLISGVIWGAWHTPIILLGYNFGRTDLSGVLFMIGGCVVWGVVLGAMRLRTGLLWPSVLAHGTLNAAGGLYLLFGTAGEQADPALVGPLGVAAWIVVAVFVTIVALATRRRVP